MHSSHATPPLSTSETPSVGRPFPYALLALDVDGTLLDAEHVLRPRVAAALRATSAAGVQIALATGKLLRSVAPLLDEAGIAGPQIVLNGAATQMAPSGDPIRFRPLAEEQRVAVINAVRAHDDTLLISHFALDGIYVDHPYPNLGIFAEYGEGQAEIVPDLCATGLPPAAKILIAGPPERLASLRAAVTPALEHHVAITTTTPDFLEFFVFEAGKGRALAALRDDLGLPREAVLAIGDGENDLPLFAEAGTSLAMANANERVRAAATGLAPSNDDEGVAVVLETLLATGKLPG